MRTLVPVDATLAWIDAATERLGTARIPLREAAGRVLAEDALAAEAIWPGNRAGLDGFAVRAGESVGASTYNPLELPLVAVAAGDVLPPGVDAVVPLDCAEATGPGRVTVVEPVAPGDNVEPRGAVAIAGAVLVPGGVRLAARHLGMLAMGGPTHAAVVRRPNVRIVLVTPRAARDSNSAMVAAAIERDGGVVEALVTVERTRSAIADALTAGCGEVVLVIGGTGPGVDDHSAAALAAAGEVAIHGVAVRPGETAGLGRTGTGVPVLLLPGTPAACLWSYELFAGRAIRRLAGRRPDLPFRSRGLAIRRKIVSAIGMTEICPVRFGSDGVVEPMPAFAEIGLMAAVGGDGFIIIPEASEGYPQGAVVNVHLYKGR